MFDAGGWCCNRYRRWEDRVGDGDEGAVLRADKRDPFGVPGTTLTGVALLASLDEEVK